MRRRDHRRGMGVVRRGHIDRLDGRIGQHRVERALRCPDSLGGGRVMVMHGDQAPPRGSREWRNRARPSHSRSRPSRRGCSRDATGLQSGPCDGLRHHHSSGKGSSVRRANRSARGCARSAAASVTARYPASAYSSAKAGKGQSGRNPPAIGTSKGFSTSAPTGSQ